MRKNEKTVRARATLSQERRSSPRTTSRSPAAKAALRGSQSAGLVWLFVDLLETD